MIEVSPEEGGDFGRLPSDALRVVFTQLFEVFAEGAGEYEEGSGWPLGTFLRQWASLCLVSKHWREVLTQAPPPLWLEAAHCPPDLLPRLLALPVRRLLLSSAADPWMSPWPWRYAGRRHQADDAGGRPRPAVVGEVPEHAPRSLVQGLPEDLLVPHELVALARAAAVPASVAAGRAGLLQSLQCLELRREPGDECAPVFCTASLPALPGLSTLALHGYADYVLEELPPTLRTLRLNYFTPADAHPVIAIPELPADLELDSLVLSSPRALGLPLASLWGSVRSVHVGAGELLIGVPVEDPALVSAFARPFVEGIYVPPHIWGDEAAADASHAAAERSVDHFFAGLAACPRLRRLKFAGHCMDSIKFFPVGPGADGTGAVGWLHGVAQHAMHLLYGLSGEELAERLGAAQAGCGGGGADAPLRALSVSASNALLTLASELGGSAPGQALGVAYEQLLLSDLTAAEAGSLRSFYTCTLEVAA